MTGTRPAAATRPPTGTADRTMPDPVSRTGHAVPDPDGTTGRTATGVAVFAPPARGVCDVWLVPVRRRAEWVGLLGSEERARWRTIGAGPAADTLLTSRAAQRLVVARYLGVSPEEVTVERSCALCGAPRHGRPRVPGAAVDFSVSHTDQWLLIAVVGGADGSLVGADLDRLDPGRDADGLAALTLTPAEHAAYVQLPDPERPVAFLDAWVRKEAAMKLTGHGLSAPPAAIDVRTPLATAPGVTTWPRTALHLTALAAPPGHRAALATTAPLTRVERHTLPE
ncbi:4'-phosphopantetheinyl transferase [Actinacidiphila alni]|uniref:4'-phosphopantetheinyl transferase n=1 Tax=Actinacidiphila alni TaxID=380248 RepID=A0A1I2EAU6_9ACTN|nr:4'-phosphopantetheinyl transferase superfamily protein [Actinacidiphila alni]SFE90124.1 4'-phosphopantetheinyl transferase [Actinacidiphila alni]